MRLAVLGGGAWGAALAHVAQAAGHGVPVWSRRPPLARRHGVAMPIVDAVHAIVDEGQPPEQDIARLISRPLGPEIR